MLRPAKATLLPGSEVLGNLPRPNLTARPPLSKALDAHAVTPFPRAHTTALSTSFCLL